MKSKRNLTEIIMLIAAFTAIMLFGTASSWAMGTKDKAPKYKIGITQIATHPGIDLVRKGFMDGMKEQGFEEGKNVTYDFQNAQGQMPVAQTIAQKFVSDQVDLIFVITTPSAQAVVKASQGTGIPVVFGAVTDPVSAGIVKNMKRPGGNVTGTSDILPVKEQFELLLAVAPNVKKIGVVFNPGESNSKFMMGVIEEIAHSLSLEILKVPVSNTNEVQQAAQSLVGRCDALYSGASNTVESAIQALVKVSESNHLPLLVAASSSVEKGGFGSIGNDYFDVGKESARLAAEILLKGKKPGELPVARATRFEYYFNLKSANASGVVIPEDLLKKAAKIFK